MLSCRFARPKSEANGSRTRRLHHPGSRSTIHEAWEIVGSIVFG
jgi:hypothetical protein